MSVHVGAGLRGLELDASLNPARVTAIVGPNGAGKTTLLQLISGLLKPGEGSVTINDKVVSDLTRHTPAHKRPVALLEQRPLLFPHLTVRANVAFGPRSRGHSTAEATQRADAELAAVGAAHLAERRPHALSGGEGQRVALARALAIDPAVVLLDEPFASLDVATATDLRHLLATRLPATGATVGLVTHDPLDVWALADDVLCIEDGQVRARGTVAEVFGKPSTGFLADLAGVNLLRVTVDGQRLTMGADELSGLWDSALNGRHALATFAPSAVALYVADPHGSPRNAWPVTVTGLQAQGPAVRVHLQLRDGQPLAADLTAAGVAELGLRPGQVVIAQVKATQVTVYARAT